MVGRRYSIAIEMENKTEHDPLNKPVIGFLVDQNRRDKSAVTDQHQDEDKYPGTYCLYDLDNFSQLNHQFKESSDPVNPSKKHVRRPTVAVKFQVPYSVSCIGVAGQS